MRKILTLTGAGILLSALSACAALTSSSAGSAQDQADARGAGSHLTIDNCGEDVTFDSVPERVILLESAPVTILDGLGVLDHVVAKAGSFPHEYYDADLAERIDAIPVLSEDIDASGHLVISSEVVLALEPDLALGLPDGISRETLLDNGANTLIQSVYCPGGVGDTTFETLYAQIQVYGKIFDREKKAEEMIEALRSRVEAVEDATSTSETRTAAVLYPSIGGGPLYAYGRSSMAHPQLSAAGFQNVFGDVSDRVFEVNIEQLIDLDPEVLILLYQGSEEGVREEVADLPGASALTAIQNGSVLLQLFNFTEPPTPLSVTGLERIVEKVGS